MGVVGGVATKTTTSSKKSASSSAASDLRCFCPWLAECELRTSRPSTKQVAASAAERSRPCCWRRRRRHDNDDSQGAATTGAVDEVGDFGANNDNDDGANSSTQRVASRAASVGRVCLALPSPSSSPLPLELELVQIKAAKELVARGLSDKPHELPTKTSTGTGVAESVAVASNGNGRPGTGASTELDYGAERALSRGHECGAVAASVGAAAEPGRNDTKLTCDDSGSQLDGGARTQAALKPPLAVGPKRRAKPKATTTIASGAVVPAPFVHFGAATRDDDDGNNNNELKRRRQRRRLRPHWPHPNNQPQQQQHDDNCQHQCLAGQQPQSCQLAGATTREAAAQQRLPKTPTRSANKPKVASTAILLAATFLLLLLFPLRLRLMLPAPASEPLVTLALVFVGTQRSSRALTAPLSDSSQRPQAFSPPTLVSSQPAAVATATVEVAAALPCAGPIEPSSCCCQRRCFWRKGRLIVSRAGGTSGNNLARKPRRGRGKRGAGGGGGSSRENTFALIGGKGVLVAALDVVLLGVDCAARSSIARNSTSGASNVGCAIGRRVGCNCKSCNDNLATSDFGLLWSQPKKQQQQHCTSSGNGARNSASCASLNRSEVGLTRIGCSGGARSRCSSNTAHHNKSSCICIGGEEECSKCKPTPFCELARWQQRPQRSLKGRLEEQQQQRRQESRRLCGLSCAGLSAESSLTLAHSLEVGHSEERSLGSIESGATGSLGVAVLAAKRKQFEKDARRLGSSKRLDGDCDCDEEEEGEEEEEDQLNCSHELLKSARSGSVRAKQAACWPLGPLSRSGSGCMCSRQSGGCWDSNAEGASKSSASVGESASQRQQGKPVAATPFGRLGKPSANTGADAKREHEQEGKEPAKSARGATVLAELKMEMELEFGLEPPATNGVVTVAGAAVLASRWRQMPASSSPVGRQRRLCIAPAETQVARLPLRAERRLPGSRGSWNAELYYINGSNNQQKIGHETTEAWRLVAGATLDGCHSLASPLLAANQTSDHEKPPAQLVGRRSSAAHCGSHPSRADKMEEGAREEDEHEAGARVCKRAHVGQPVAGVLAKPRRDCDTKMMNRPGGRYELADNKTNHITSSAATQANENQGSSWPAAATTTTTTEKKELLASPAAGEHQQEELLKLELAKLMGQDQEQTNVSLDSLIRRQKAASVCAHLRGYWLNSNSNCNFGLLAVADLKADEFSVASVAIAGDTIARVGWSPKRQTEAPAPATITKASATVTAKATGSSSRRGNIDFVATFGESVSYLAHMFTLQGAYKALAGNHRSLLPPTLPRGPTLFSPLAALFLQLYIRMAHAGSAQLVPTGEIVLDLRQQLARSSQVEKDAATFNDLLIGQELAEATSRTRERIGASKHRGPHADHAHGRHLTRTNSRSSPKWHWNGHELAYSNHNGASQQTTNRSSAPLLASAAANVVHSNSNGNRNRNHHKAPQLKQMGALKRDYTDESSLASSWPARRPSRWLSSSLVADSSQIESAASSAPNYWIELAQSGRRPSAATLLVQSAPGSVRQTPSSAPLASTLDHLDAHGESSLPLAPLVLQSQTSLGQLALQRRERFANSAVEATETRSPSKFADQRRLLELLVNLSTRNGGYAAGARLSQVSFESSIGGQPTLAAKRDPPSHLELATPIGRRDYADSDEQSSSSVCYVEPGEPARFDRVSGTSSERIFSQVNLGTPLGELYVEPRATLRTTTTTDGHCHPSSRRQLTRGKPTTEAGATVVWRKYCRITFNSSSSSSSSLDLPIGRRQQQLGKRGQLNRRHQLRRQEDSEKEANERDQDEPAIVCCCVEQQQRQQRRQLGRQSRAKQTFATVTQNQHSQQQAEAAAGNLVEERQLLTATTLTSKANESQLRTAISIEQRYNDNNQQLVGAEQQPKLEQDRSERSGPTAAFVEVTLPSIQRQQHSSPPATKGEIDLSGSAAATTTSVVGEPQVRYRQPESSAKGVGSSGSSSSSRSANEASSLLPAELKQKQQQQQQSKATHAKVSNSHRLKSVTSTALSAESLNLSNKHEKLQTLQVGQVSSGSTSDILSVIGSLEEEASSVDNRVFEGVGGPQSIKSQQEKQKQQRLKSPIAGVGSAISFDWRNILHPAGCSRANKSACGRDSAKHDSTEVRGGGSSSFGSGGSLRSSAELTREMIEKSRIIVNRSSSNNNSSSSSSSNESISNKDTDIGRSNTNTSSSNSNSNSLSLNDTDRHRMLASRLASSRPTTTKPSEATSSSGNSSESVVRFGSRKLLALDTGGNSDDKRSSSNSSQLGSRANHSIGPAQPTGGQRKLFSHVESASGLLKQQQQQQQQEEQKHLIDRVAFLAPSSTVTTNSTIASIDNYDLHRQQQLYLNNNSSRSSNSTQLTSSQNSPPAISYLSLNHQHENQLEESIYYQEHQEQDNDKEHHNQNQLDTFREAESAASAAADFPPLPTLKTPTTITEHFNINNSNQQQGNFLERIFYLMSSFSHQISAHHSLPIALILGLIILVTFIGNVLVCLSVIKVRKLRHPSNYLLISLAISDLCVACVVMPFGLYQSINDKWQLGRLLCNVYVVSDVTSCTASILNLCVISIDRYLAITRPLTYCSKRTTRLMLILIGIVWICACLISVPPLLISGNEYGTAEEPRCEVSQSLWYQLYATCISFYIPLIVMICLYYNIYTAAKKVVEAEQRATTGLNSVKPINNTSSSNNNKNNSGNIGNNANNTNNSNSNNNNGNNANENNNNNNNNRNGNKGINANNNSVALSVQTRTSSVMRERKASITLGVIMSAFTICWLPFFIIALLRPFSETVDKLPRTFVLLTLWLGYANSLLNPIIYVTFHHDFRNAFKHLLCLRCMTINEHIRKDEYRSQYGETHNIRKMRNQQQQQLNLQQQQQLDQSQLQQQLLLSKPMFLSLEI